MKTYVGKGEEPGDQVRSAQVQVYVQDGAHVYPMVSRAGAAAACPIASRAIVDWGQESAAAYNLAHAILADSLGQAAAERYAHAFMVEVVAELPEPAFELPEIEVRRWYHKKCWWDRK